MKAYFLTNAEWEANDRAAAKTARPFPRITRRVCPSDCKVGYFQTEDGRWWTENDQLGYVEVLPTSRALVHTLNRMGETA